MPEGPSIVLLKEAVEMFARKKVLHASGNTRQFDPTMLEGKAIRNFKSWGKHFLICFPTFTLRIHFLLFGSYLINERKATPPRLSLQFKNGEINFYACGLRMLEESPDDVYDWSADVMSEQWSSSRALQKLKAIPDTLVCDAILDQTIFSGAGNIIKNEVLFRIHVHPLSTIGKLSPAKRRQLVEEVVRYSYDFLAWKREFTLRKHWLAHTKKTCPRDGAPLQKAYLGKTNRRTFYCEVCQKLYV
ncbi:endonuclease [Dawidia soli]|uniref:Endonuclease n=1 Tax=Dawidia soli TaxID=2782352 RepID=A0AAP2DAH4_9BACT|nr:endonuclease [Dawidia soli]MBT1688428.1 endonuclease [Dawidia soli]